MESQSWVHESVEDNEGIANDLVLEKLGDTSGSKVQSNGSLVAENSDKNVLNHVEESKIEALSTPTNKGNGLKKWRRIKRDANRDRDTSIDMVAHHDSPRSVSGATPSKRMQFSDGKQQTSDGSGSVSVSVSSTNAVVRNFDGPGLLDDPSLGLRPSFAAGTDSENSEDRSSKSSTAASAPKMRYGAPVNAGFLPDKSKIGGLNGKNSNSTHAVQSGHQGKGRTEYPKKARGERVKIEKENSHSSVESDSRSSNFVFAQGTFSPNNGMRNEGTNEYDGENGDEFVGIGKQLNHGHQGGYGKDGEGGFADLSPEDGVADSSWAGKDERSESHGSMRDKDPLAESLRALLSVQEALQQEVQKFKEIGNDVSIDGPISDLCNEYVDVEQKPQETNSEGSQKCSQPKALETGNRRVAEAEAELEELFKQKVEAEVEYLALSRSVQKLRVAAVDHITVFEEQKALRSEQTKVLDKLEDNENKAAALKKQAEKLENICEEIASADEVLKLQKGACKYGLCFVVQLVLLFVFVGIFILEFSKDYVEVVPT